MNDQNAPTHLDINPKPTIGPRISGRVKLLVALAFVLLLAAIIYGRMWATAKREQAIKEADASKIITPASTTEVTKGFTTNSKQAYPTLPANTQPGLQTAPEQQQTNQPTTVAQQPTYQPAYVPPPPVYEQHDHQERDSGPTDEEKALKAAMEAGTTPALQRQPGAVGGDHGFTANMPRPTAERTQELSGDDYRNVNFQRQKQAFLEQQTGTSNYLPSTRTPALSAYEIKAGWEIPAVLDQEMNSDLPGELKAHVNHNVYDTATGHHLLIPQGSMLIGRYNSEISYGQSGVQAVWSRIIFPDASSIDLGNMTGMDATGNAGFRGKTNRHYARTFGIGALTSLFAVAYDLSQRRGSQMSQQYGGYSAGDTAAASVGREMSQTGNLVTRRNLNVQPTIKVPVGYKFMVRVNKDILFGAPYAPMKPLSEETQPRTRRASR